MKPRTTSYVQPRSSADLWASAHTRINAEHGMGNSANALHKAVTIKSLIQSIGTNPDAFELLAARRHEMSAAQIDAALQFGLPPKAAKVAKAQPKAATMAPRGLSGVPLWGKHGGPLS